MTAFRNSLPDDAKMIVAKNTLLRIAAGKWWSFVIVQPDVNDGNLDLWLQWLTQKTLIFACVVLQTRLRAGQRSSKPHR